MRRRLGSLCVALGAALILLSAALLLRNRAEDAAAGDAAQAVLPQLLTRIDMSRENRDAPAPTRPEADAEMPVAEIDGQEYVGCLTIPALELELPIMADWSYEKLRTAPCRQSGTVAGENLVIAGHNYAHHFGSLSTLAPGETVLFTDMEGVTTAYTVALTEILQPDQVEEMLRGDYPLTLYTCTYGGKTRVTVRCWEFQ